MGMNQNYSTISNLESWVNQIFYFGWMGMNQNYSTISNLESWFFLEFMLPFDAYKIKLWIILIKLLFSNI
ncbi:unnamed protein product [Musa hybrid cultivar]